jgi:hypothetical protein
MTCAISMSSDTSGKIERHVTLLELLQIEHVVGQREQVLAQACSTCSA